MPLRSPSNDRVDVSWLNGVRRADRDSLLTRRAMLGAAAALGAAAGSALLPGKSEAQTPGATPVGATPVPSVSQSVPGGSVRLIRPGANVENFNPAAFAQDPQIPLSYLEPLLRPDPRTMAPQPWLAEGWTWDEDGLRVRLAVREGIAWQDGTTLDAADAAFSYTVYRDDAESAVAGLFSLVNAIEASSERELTVVFLERDPNWLFNAATLPIFSRRQYQAHWESMSEAGRTLSSFDWSTSPPIGTGPWQIETWDAQRVMFSPFADYWGAKPWLDTLEVAVEVGVRRRLEAWESDESQILWPVSAAIARAVPEGKGTVVAVPAASVMFAAFNFANPNQPNGSLWSDLRVRQAASMAIDRQRYADEVFAGSMRADAAGTVAQPWAHDDSVNADAFNRERAAVLLAEAGWVDYDGDGILEDAVGTPLRPVAIVREDSRPELARVLAAVLRDWLEVGIALSVDVLNADDFEDRWISRRDYDMIAYAYDLLPGFTDFDLYGSAWDIRTNPAGWNPGGYSNPNADAAIDEFLGAVSIVRQRAALARLQRAVNDDLFGLWFGFPDDLILIAKGVEGFEPDIAWQTAQTWTLWRSTTES